MTLSTSRFSREKREAAPSSRRKLGVIDIGSNSVRLVVYDVEMGVPFQIFNEKVLCGLGRGVATTGLLNAEGRTLASATIRRFAALAKEMRVETILAVATAAVREAEDGPDFIRDIKTSCDLTLDVLSGEEEARYSALGVKASIRGADGTVGDLGGGSLELVDIVNGRPQTGITLPFGALRLIDEFGKNMPQARKEIDARLTEIPWLNAGRGRPFYAVGGAWRALAEVHIEQGNYPLHVLHQYRIPRDEVLDLTSVIASLGPETLARMSSVSSKRAVTLPYAALVLGRLFEATGGRSLIVSAFGLREGLAYDWLYGEESEHDLLIEMCRELGRSRGRFGDHGEEIMDWIDPLFPDETEPQRRLRLAACLLSDIGWSGHPDYRAEIVLQEVLHSQLVGVDHEDRAIIALALYTCYGGKGNRGQADAAFNLLFDDQAKYAVVLGHALRLAQRISGGTEGILDKCALESAEPGIVLRVPTQYGHLVSEVVERRLKALARAAETNYAICH